MQSATFKAMILDLLDYQLFKNGKHYIYYLKDNENNFHKVSELDLYDCKTKCEDGYYDYNEYILEDEGNNDRLFIKIS